ncbi:MAG: hypothetical protein LUH19_06350 [Lachnospiraceae bacterium]|nr:hypothetical protein [Lachnospiraceae bacterium]
MARNPAGKRDNVVSFPKQSKLNIGVIILAVVFIYIMVCVATYLSREQIQSYQVREGSLVEDTRYSGVIIRQEDVIYSDGAGYVNYFTAEKERVAVGNLVYTLDSSGTIKDYTDLLNADENSLSEDDKEEFRYLIDSFLEKYSDDSFSSVYELHTTLTSQTDKLVNNLLLENINTLYSSTSSMIEYHYASETGIVAYWIDGLEDLEAGEVSSSLFDSSSYSRTELVSNSLVADGESVYKVLPSEYWDLVITDVEEENLEYYLSEEVVQVRFLKNDLLLWADVSAATNSLGETLLVLSFQSGSVNFSTDRFLEIEIITDDDTGLKIPISSIVEKSFYLVPEEYVSYVEEENAYYILIESYGEDGLTVTRTEVEPYSLKENDYYLDDASIDLGTRIYKLDSSDVYTVSSMGTLTGVYNINKGYAEFRQITILDENELYAIVQSNTTYGLSAYDYIVLNADAVDENDFIYE